MGRPWGAIGACVATESKKSKRGGARNRAAEISAALAQAQADPLGPSALKAMAVRIGVVLAAVWVVCGSIAGFTQSRTTTTVSLSIAAVLTLALVGVALWALKRASKARDVAGILANVKSEEDRQRAISQLDQGFKANDPAAIFAKAQLEMQDDPRKALVTLETIDLKKVMAAVADEARAQRAMLHLMLGEPSKARDLADGIELTRHQDSRSKAMMSSVIAESWARTGQARKALVTIEVFNPEDAAFAQVRPQMYRARAFVYAYVNDTKSMKRALRRLAQLDARLLGGFLVNKKTHPLLQKEARVLLEQSGQMPRKMQVQRM